MPQPWHSSKSHDYSNHSTGLYVRFHHSQENAAGQEQEQWALYQPVVGPAEPRQAGVGVLHFRGPLLPRLKHCGEVPEGAATRRGLNPADRGKKRKRKKSVKLFKHGTKSWYTLSIFIEAGSWLKEPQRGSLTPDKTTWNDFNICFFLRKFKIKNAIVCGSSCRWWRTVQTFFLK